MVDIDKLGKLCDWLLANEREVAIDLETGYASSEPDRDGGALDWDWPKQFVCGLSISGDPSWARYVPLRHDCGGNVEDEPAAWEAMRPLLTKGRLTAHHEKFEERGVLKSSGYSLASDGGVLEDTMIMTYALGGVYRREDMIRACYGLKDLVEVVGNHKMTHIEDLFPVKLTERQLKSMRFNVLDLNQKVVAYACEDAAWTLWLRHQIRERAFTERPMMFALEHEISRLLAEMEGHGVGVDWAGMHAAQEAGATFLPRMEATIKAGLSTMAGYDVSGINLGSSQQMQALLYRDGGMTTTRMTPGAEKKLVADPNTPKWKLMSTDGNAMNGLAKKHPAIKKLLEHREAMNMQNRLGKWINEVEPYTRDGRAHANYRQAGAEDSNAAAPGTGRFSASDPPIQQCPKEWRWSLQLGLDVQKDEEGWQQCLASGVNGTDYWNGHFREFIVAAPDHYLVTFDFSQIELRVLAGVSQEPALLRAFENDVDVHRATAAQMLGKRVEDVTDKERQDFGKRLNFALLYQEGPVALAEQLTVSVERAKQMMAQYFAAFSKVSSWQEHATARGLRLGYAETCFGRRYQVWELKSKSKAMQAKGKRVLVNAPIQGGAADYMKISMIRVARALKERGWWPHKVMLVMNQHDSLMFECSNDMDPNEVRAVLEERVTFPVHGFPKIVADWEIGQTWGGSVSWKPGKAARWNGDQWTLTESTAVDKAVDKAVEEPVDEQQPASNVVNTTQLCVAVEQVEVPPIERAKEGSVVIHATRIPDRESFGRLLTLVASKPGDAEVVFRCPAGDVPLGQSSLSMADSGRVSLILGGAMMTAAAGAAEIRSLASGLSL